jgi:hypothetical protein
MRDGTEVSDPRLGRLIQFDERSRDYSIRKIVTWQPLRSRTYRMPRNEGVLDQGREGSCVGFGVTNEIRATPRSARGLDGTFAREKIYWPAQRDDPWAGGAYPGATPFYEGTAVLAGVKAAVQLGYYGAYHWAFSERDLALAIGWVGPAILGLNWYTGMFSPDDNGFIRPTGQVEGGHCILALGYNNRSGYYTLLNSWGPSWGIRGRCYVRTKDMVTLLQDSGEACIVTERNIVHRGE